MASKIDFKQVNGGSVIEPQEIGNVWKWNVVGDVDFQSGSHLVFTDDNAIPEEIRTLKLVQEMIEYNAALGYIDLDKTPVNVNSVMVYVSGGILQNGISIGGIPPAYLIEPTNTKRIYITKPGVTLSEPRPEDGTLFQIVYGTVDI